jgi:hydroxyacylglutathione hydrolase
LTEDHFLSTNVWFATEILNERSTLRIEKLAPGSKLCLTNDGELELFWIGVGSPLAKRNDNTNLLIIQGAVHVLVDFGITGPRALFETTGLEMTDIKVILPTHLHADHVGGIEQMAHAHHYLRQEKQEMIITEDFQDRLWERTLRGGLEFDENVAQNGKFLGFSDYYDAIRPIQIENRNRRTWRVNVGGLSLELFKTDHVPDSAPGWNSTYFSVGVFIGNRVFVSMDSRFDPQLIMDYSVTAETMFHDVQFTSGPLHASLADLRSLNDLVKRRMHFMHYADSYEEKDITDFAGWTQPGVRYIFD